MRTVAPGFEEPSGPEIECFDEALRRGTGAEVVVRHTTQEGDPIVSYYRWRPDEGGLEIFIDATQDASGSGRWEHAVCPAATRFSHLGDCDEA